MMGLEYYRVVAYFTPGGGGIVCRACGEKAGYITGDSLTESQVYSDFAEDGLSCEKCFAEIVAPVEPEDEEIEDNETEEG